MKQEFVVQELKNKIQQYANQLLQHCRYSKGYNGHCTFKKCGYEELTMFLL